MKTITWRERLVRGIRNESAFPASSSRLFIIGDIEESSDAFTDAIECLRMLERGDRVVFLGDIYTSHSTKLSIRRIANILCRLRIPIRNYIDISFWPSEHTPEEVAYFSYSIRQCFTNLYEYQKISIYSANNKIKTSAAFNEILERDLNMSYDSNTSFVFLFGNKEVDVISDLHSVSEACVHEVNNECVFTGKYTYYYKHKRYDSVIEMNLEELNILLNYLYLCRHFYYENYMLMTHIYTNGRTIMKQKNFPTVKKTFSGHNRCYGTYNDVRAPTVDINLLDVSHEQQHFIKNYIVIPRPDLHYAKYITEHDDIRSLLIARMSANKTFLRGGWGTGKHISTLDMYRSGSGSISRDSDEYNDSDDQYTEDNDDD